MPGCQYGGPDELPRLEHRRAYDKTAPPRPAVGSSKRLPR